MECKSLPIACSLLTVAYAPHNNFSGITSAPMARDQQAQYTFATALASWQAWFPCVLRPKWPDKS